MKVENRTGDISWSGASGDMNVDSRYFIASVTKMYITVMVMKLIEEDKIALEDLIRLNDKLNNINGIVLEST